MSAVVCLLSGAHGASDQDATQDFALFPLADGNQWALSNPWVGWPAYATVAFNRVYGGKRFAWLRVDTPFGSTTLILGASPDGVTFEGVAADDGRTWFDDGLPLFVPAPAGTVRENETGKVTVVNDRAVVRTRAGVFTDCLHVRLDLRSGASQEFFLAPGIGLVRLGPDEFPFLLDIANIRPYMPSPPQAAATAPIACPKVGIDPNPIATEDFSLPSSREYRLQEAVDHGNRFLQLSATWAELEPVPGVYRFDALLQGVEWAERYDLQTVLTIKTVDTVVSAVPADLKEKPLDDPEVLRRFRGLLAALLPLLPARVQWVNLANEVDTYFSGAPERVGPFVTFLEAGREEAKSVAANKSVGVVFAVSDLRRSDAVFRALLFLCDHVSFTYYPMRKDLTARPPSVAASDIAEAVSLAGSKPVIFTEIGYPSSPDLGASETAQEEFYKIALAALETQAGRIAGASFFLMSDLPVSAVDELMQYYGMASDSRFRAFLASLGLHNIEGGAKPAWHVFSEQARRQAANPECVSLASSAPSALLRPNLAAIHSLNSFTYRSLRLPSGRGAGQEVQ